jgi:hypothetical protein
MPSLCERKELVSQVRCVGEAFWVVLSTTTTMPTPMLHSTPTALGCLEMQICAQIREENQHKPFSLSAVQCRGCMTFSKGDPDKMCLSYKRNRGCNLVNARYELQHGKGATR